MHLVLPLPLPSLCPFDLILLPPQVVCLPCVKSVNNLSQNLLGALLGQLRSHRACGQASWIIMQLQGLVAATGCKEVAGMPSCSPTRPLPQHIPAALCRQGGGTELWSAARADGQPGIPSIRGLHRVDYVQPTPCSRLHTPAMQDGRAGRYVRCLAGCGTGGGIDQLAPPARTPTP